MSGSDSRWYAGMTEKHFDLAVNIAVRDALKKVEDAKTRDTQLLDYLDKNLFHQETSEWDRKYGACRDGQTICWMLYAPKGVQGSARNILEAALTRSESVAEDTNAEPS